MCEPNGEKSEICFLLSCHAQMLSYDLIQKKCLAVSAGASQAACLGASSSSQLRGASAAGVLWHLHRCVCIRVHANMIHLNRQLCSWGSFERGPGSALGPSTVVPCGRFSCAAVPQPGRASGGQGHPQRVSLGSWAVSSPHSS